MSTYVLLSRGLALPSIDPFFFKVLIGKESPAPLYLFLSRTSLGKALPSLTHRHSNKAIQGIGRPAAVAVAALGLIG
jgi:hypothetical protein